ncbi:ABC transporter permease [Dethiobacter alkaliphilus]|uniref:ABC transporter permease n=1 Tax=Dethiobacter alkaliphilus TaxID=427926 RepID=UPI00222670DB|nr:ABC transporter permease [Dethiobacter alkaliphilus]MCW3489520.1 ABC transporter permease [Dethiobacter alkaliphilus]
MTFFKTNMQRILTSKVRMLIILVVPLLFILIFTSLDYEKPLQLAVIDADQTPFTRELAQSLEENFRIVDVAEDEIVPALIEGEADYVVVLPDGFTQELVRGESPQVEGYSISGTNMALPVEAFINSYLDGANDVAETANYNEALFYQGMKVFSEGQLFMSFTVNDDISRNKSTTAMGFLVQFMLYMSVMTTGIIAEDRQNKTIFRIFSGPVSMKRYMAESLLSFMMIAALQVIAIIGLLHFGVNLYFGNSVLNMIVLFLFFAVVTVALGMIISNYAKTPVHAYVTILLLTTPLVMLGGSYWPRDYMPDILVSIGNFLPTSWVMSGVQKLLYGGDLSSITQELMILTAFAGVFFLVGTMRRADVAK